MSIVASLLSIILFLAFVSAGIQKVQFNPMMSATAQRLGFAKSSYQRIGLLEIVGAIALLIGLASARGSLWGIVNEAAALALAFTMALAVIFHLRKGDGVKELSPALVLGLLALVELASRLV
ncbi:MAG: DoxX family protein [Acidimicrobiaceae bacterium]|nr:DoxX family protein [Acidimicrobiaceae bacterium]